MSFLNKVRNSFLSACIGFLPVAMLQSCSDDDNGPNYPNGTYMADWAEVNDAAIDGEIMIFNFEATAPWTAASTEEWCKVLSPEGVAGQSTLRLEIAPNTSLKGRSTEVTISVAGAAEQTVVAVRQGDGDIEHGSGTYRDVNKWVYDYMAEMYLWNDNIPKLELDYSVDYQSFLKSMLDGVASFDNANKDDGVMIGDQRIYFTYIDSNAPISRGVGDQINDSGIMSIGGARFEVEGGGMALGLVIRLVAPDTEAAKAGIKRGDFITKVNGITVTESNYQSLASSIFKGNVTVTVNDVDFTGSAAVVTPRGDISFSSSVYTDPAIYKASVATTASGKKVGYLLHMGFDMAYDEQMIDIFNLFKTEGIDELIIDLRYNPGGMVLSSTVLGTLVAGSQHKDKIYLRTTYNSARTAKGEKGEYFIGNPSNPENPEGYQNIAKALDAAVGLKRVFVITSGTTASASELLINGLRGIGIEVNTIGLRTLGKNAGMEGIRQSFLRYVFTFYPITFYCENAQGFRDYAGGFPADLELDETSIYPGDFGTSADYLSRAALQWADTGQKPSTGRSRSAAGTISALDVTDNDNAFRRMGGSIVMRGE